MKIITKLILLSITFVTVIAGIGLLTAETFSRINKEVQEGHDANLMMKDVFELNMLTNQYMMFHEKRMQLQWVQKYNSFGNLLDRMRRKESHLEHQPILAGLMKDYNALGTLFSQLQDNFAKRKSHIEKNGPKVKISMTFSIEERLVTQTLMRSQKIVSGVFEVSGAIQKNIITLQERTNLIVLLSTIGFIILSICISFFAIKSITVPINTLVTGSEIVGTGNWEHKLGTKSKDEIGQLSRAFDRMIDNLKEITASRDEFEREISERKRAEEEREKLISELEVALYKVKTLSGMLPICASCKKIRDDKGYWNQIEAYIGDHSEAQFSHGICPDCAKKLYPEFYKG